MAIKFTNRTVELGIVQYKILDAHDEEIGSIEGGVTNGSFVCNINIDTQFHKKGFGYEAFEMIYNEMNLRDPIEIINGSWHKSPLFDHLNNGMSTNLLIYLQSKVSQNQIDSAFSTPTGRWAKKLGFTKCKIITDVEDHVEVRFTR